MLTDPHSLMLWYDRPAEEWLEALPIGNGRLGAMVFGGAAHERLQVNEDTLWSGCPRSYVKPEAHRALPRIEEFLRDGRQEDAEALAMEEFMSTPLNQEKYLPCANLLIETELPENVTSFRRQLDLTEAMATTCFTAGGVTFRRDCFASFPAQAIVVRLTADRAAALNLTLALDSPHLQTQVDAVPNTSQAAGQAELLLAGHVSDYVHPRSEEIRPCAIRFALVLQVDAEGGTVEAEEDRLRVRDADSVTLLLSARTNYRSYKDISGVPLTRCRQDLAELADCGIEKLQEMHRLDHQRLFKAVSLRLGPDDDRNAVLPTDERLRRFAEVDDPGLVALMFQYGRYLLIASSRPGSQPANLQGIWNDLLSPPWDSKWTVNINTEMNYWPAETTGLAECHEPLFAMLEEVAQTGAETAQAHYQAGGWVLHHNTDIWRGAAPINHANHGIWPTGGAWLCRHLWEHVAFQPNREKLSRFYAVMRGAAQFFLERLQPDPQTGELISLPSNSPEQGGLVIGPAMDHQIIRELFTHCILAAEELNIDAAFRESLREARERLAADRIGRWGQLQEWLADVDDPDNQHRHLSHLYALHPGAEISPLETPKLAEAARVSLAHRGDEATGWSMGWKINLWARLLDGDHAHTIIRNFFTLREPGEKGGGIYPNLFCSHPPFQIDGNFGAAAGVAEMLLQSHLHRENDTYLLHLLPALPSCWKEGEVTGLRARGGVTVAVSWKDARLSKAVLQGKPGKELPLMYGRKQIVQSLNSSGQCVVTGDDFTAD